MFYIFLLIVIWKIPYPSNQHFVWPLHWCLLADICNHTWIPECGSENDEDVYSRRLFIDECDMYEYNCDFESDYYAINYSDCFNIPVTPCPTKPPCPSRPTCPDHRFHSMGDKKSTVPSRRMGRKLDSTKINLPIHMLKGKRRYSPTWRKKKRRSRKSTMMLTTKLLPKKHNQNTFKTVILKKETIVKNGKRYMKIVKGFVRKNSKFTKSDKSDFLE